MIPKHAPLHFHKRTLMLLKERVAPSKIAQGIRDPKQILGMFHHALVRHKGIGILSWLYPELILNFLQKEPLLKELIQ